MKKGFRNVTRREQNGGNPCEGGAEMEENCEITECKDDNVFCKKYPVY